MNETSTAVRRAFLDFFRGQGHEVVQSGPLVPPNDPTLLFANAGMVQFKDLFTGREKRAYTRAASSQKCIRISGKHNDLEAVGPSPRHHTFFEMLGNFSFGDYFKEAATVFAWDFLTKTLCLPPERMIFTYFKGEEGIPTDTQARDLWTKITGFGADRVRGLGMSDNFWQMGDTGPCGPSSEIYFYNGQGVRLDQFGEEQTPEGQGWMEIWNLVFMQFERSIVDGTAKLDPLPAPSIDTGAGLERVSGVVQGKTSNYDVDLLREIVESIARIAGKNYGASMNPDDVSMRVIADHARTTAFLIAEGVFPDRTGREYVLRRVMRRAVRHGHRLGIERPFLHEVALKVVELMGDHFSELRARSELIASIAEQEESRFRATIERGLGLLEERFSALPPTGQPVLAGADAFQLYDTYGFPLDLTQVICNERGIAVDLLGYESALEAARARSEFKSAATAVESVYRAALESVESGSVKFVGYEREESRSVVNAMVVDGALAEQASEGQVVEVVVAETPFYAESGGQVGDQGQIETPTGRFLVSDTQKPLPGLLVHRGHVASGTLSVGQGATLSIDVERRNATRRNHSATHLLHLALRTLLGEHAQQKGSIVGPERLRFDFTHDRALTREQLTEIEQFVNRRVLENVSIRTEVMDVQAARQRGAMMIFEEKYGDVVRMLTMGDSVELCGGTHARATGDIGLFKITSEQGIAAGVRRIIGVTGIGMADYVNELEQRLAKAAEKTKSSPADLVDKIGKIIDRQKELEKQVEELERKLLTGTGGGIDSMLSLARDFMGVRVLALRTEVADRAALRELAEQLRDRLGNAIVLVGSVADGKAQLVLTVAKALVGRYSAGDLIKPVAVAVGGSGGGRPDMAQAGGTQPERLDQALAVLLQRFETQQSET
jgi:alanyl-tRNA synthetase